MNKVKYIAPNLLTMLNLMCGIAAIISLFESQPQHPYLPVILLICAAVFDVFDGLVAKVLKATSEFGKQLDSLSDLISFGVAPAIMMYKLLTMALIYQSSTASFLIENASLAERLILYASLLIAVFAALRLARFNITSAASNEFIGLPVPASALIVVSVWIMFHLTDNELIHSFILNKWALLLLIALLSYLMISTHTMLSLKFKGVGFRANLWQYLLLIGGGALIILFGKVSLFFVMMYYLMLSITKHLLSTRQ